MNLLTQKREAGKRLGEITTLLYDFVRPGVAPIEIEEKALSLIKAYHAEPSFTKVKNYHWATCINLNSGVVHGIPTSTTPLSPKDLVTVDVGLFWQSVHADNAFTKTADNHPTPSQNRFLKAGKLALKNAIQCVKNGVHVGEISQAISRTIRRYGYTPSYDLGGHGVGHSLHEKPFIPCVLTQPITKTPRLKTGQTIAIEVIYSEGSPDLIIAEDGWTIFTKDGKLAAVFEETVEVKDDGYSILTTPALFQR